LARFGIVCRSIFEELHRIKNMDSIKFVPQSQKNLEQLEELKSKDRNNILIYFLYACFIVYITIVGGIYWIFVVREKAKVIGDIGKLDEKNSQYYIHNDLEQGLFNIVDLIENSYTPTIAIKQIESAYVLGSKVSSFSYTKSSKIVNISMTVQSINDVTRQIDAFNKINTVSSSRYSVVKEDIRNNSGFVFEVELILK